MGEHGKDAKPFRVRTYVWDASDEEGPQACELLVSDWVEAANAREAAAKAKLGDAPADADRLIVDVQRSGFSPKDKAVGWTPWRIAVVWLAGLGASEDTVRQHLERAVPSFVVECDDAGNLGVAAAAPSYLACEAMEDLEDVLHDALGDAASEALSSGMETGVRPDQPTAEELWRELVQSAEHGMETAGPPAASTPEIEEVEPEGPPERELICDLLLGITQERTPRSHSPRRGARLRRVHRGAGAELHRAVGIGTASERRLPSVSSSHRQAVPHPQRACTCRDARVPWRQPNR